MHKHGTCLCHGKTCCLEVLQPRKSKSTNSNYVQWQSRISSTRAQEQPQLLCADLLLLWQDFDSFKTGRIHGSQPWSTLQWKLAWLCCDVRHLGPKLVTCSGFGLIEHQGSNSKTICQDAASSEIIKYIDRKSGNTNYIASWKDWEMKSSEQAIVAGRKHLKTGSFLMVNDLVFDA